MGLDWRPLNKPMSGHEQEFESLHRRLKETLHEDPAVPALQQRFWEISITPYVTLGAPRVGEDPHADAWLAGRMRQAGMAEDQVSASLLEMSGFYVVPLVPECDGIPMYITPRTAFEGPHIDTEVFRAQFLDDCKDFIGDLHGAAYESKLARDLLAYGNELDAVVHAFASSRGLAWLKDQRRPPREDDAVIGAVHIGYWAAKWCVFWGSRGHGVHADW